MLSKTLLTLAFGLFLSSPVFADDPPDATHPQFTFLDYRQPAPFRGTLFNPRATAELLALPETLQLGFDLELEYQLSVQATEYQFRLDSTNTKYSALSEEYKLVASQKDYEIAELQRVINARSPSNRGWWIAGGAVGGAAITLGIVYAVVSASGK